MNAPDLRAWQLARDAGQLLRVPLGEIRAGRRLGFAPLYLRVVCGRHRWRR